MHAAIAIYEGVDDLDAFGPFEILAKAGRAGADVSARLVTVAPVEEVHTSHGATLRPAGVLHDGAVDLLVVPGGGWNDRAEHGAWAQAGQPELPEAIRRVHAAGATVASVCTGAGIVAASGLLDGRPTATHRSAAADLRARGIEVVDARVVDDGELLSAGGVTSGLDLALWLVEREWGRSLADEVARKVEYERRGPLHLGPQSRAAA